MKKFLLSAVSAMVIAGISYQANAAYTDAYFDVNWTLDTGFRVDIIAQTTANSINSTVDTQNTGVNIGTLDLGNVDALCFNSGDASSCYTNSSGAGSTYVYTDGIQITGVSGTTDPITIDVSATGGNNTTLSFGASNSINSYLGGSATHSDAVTPNNTGDFAINFDFALNVSPNDNAGAFSDTVTLTFDNG